MQVTQITQIKKTKAAESARFQCTSKTKAAEYRVQGQGPDSLTERRR